MCFRVWNMCNFYDKIISNFYVFAKVLTRCKEINWAVMWLLTDDQCVKFCHLTLLSLLLQCIFRATCFVWKLCCPLVVLIISPLYYTNLLLFNIFVICFLCYCSWYISAFVCWEVILKIWYQDSKYELWLF